MSPAELDVPLVPSAEQIRRRMFASVRRGFDPDQVRDYLEQIADQVERLEQGLKETKLEAESAKAGASKAQVAAQASKDPYKDLSSRMADLIRAADEQAQKLLADAHSEAARVLGEARGEADRIRTDAQARAEEARYQGSEALRRAREEADRALAGLSSRREKLILQLQEMQSKLLGVARELETAIDPNEQAVADLFSESPTTRGAAPPASKGSSTERAPQARAPAPAASEPIDPRYEDLWASPEAEAASTESGASGDEASEGEVPENAESVEGPEAGTVDLTMADIPQIEIDLGEESAGSERTE